MLFSGGHDDDDDTTDLDDSTDNDDDHDGDTTDVGDDHGDGDHDGDTTDVGDDHHHDGNHNENDTIDCDDDHDGDHDGDHDDDTTATNDTTDRAMFGTGSQSIVIKTSSNSALIGLQFVNNQAVNVTISKIGLAAGTNFTIVSGAPTHASILLFVIRRTAVQVKQTNCLSHRTAQRLSTQ
jgi:hypothetical protein